MDEYLERQRIIEEQRRISISNQDLQLKQGDNDSYNSKIQFLKKFCKNAKQRHSFYSKHACVARFWVRNFYQYSVSFVT